jgi:hypothetical protein
MKIWDHPSIVASVILTGGLLISAQTICWSLQKLDEDIRAKAMPLPLPFPGVIDVDIGRVPVFIVDANGKPQPVVPVVIQTNR